MSIWCHHENQTTPRRDDKGEYRRCLDCGVRIPWEWSDGLAIQPPRMLQPRDRTATLSPKPSIVWSTERKSA